MLDGVSNYFAGETIPACEALVAHARGNYDEVVCKMGSAISRVLEIDGGIFFEQVMLDQMIHAGRYSAAQQILEIPRGHHPHVT